MNDILRRSMLAGLAAVAASAPAWGRSGAGPPVVGFIGFAAREADPPLVDGLRAGLREAGHVEGKTLVLDVRHANGDVALAHRLIEEMGRRPVDVLVAPGPAAIRAAHKLTELTIVGVGLPPRPGDHGLFETLAKPGGRVTGLSYFGEELARKRIEILRALLPQARVLGILHNATDPVFSQWGVQSAAAAEELGLRAVRLGLRSIDQASVEELLGDLKRQGGDALVVVRDFLTTSTREAIIEAATRLGIPVIAEEGRFAAGGALLVYGADIPDLFRRAGGYVDRILKGDKPGDLPIQLPTKLTMSINLRAAKALGVEVPPDVLARADEVIE